ncbi:hypothetical protein BDR04DRAFT_1123277 [Suillus decipiens]|nr:hypothetical protein BDR04DRAFT_1123277 [Suillus decipiens]
MSHFPDDQTRQFSNDSESSRARHPENVADASLRHDLGWALLNDSNHWPALHNDTPHPNLYADSSHPGPPPSDQPSPATNTSHHDSVPEPLPQASAVNWVVHGLFHDSRSDPASGNQEAGPSSQSQDLGVLPKNFTFDDRTAYQCLLSSRTHNSESSHSARRKPYDRARPSARGAPRHYPMQQEADVVEAMKRSIFNGAFLPEPDELVSMARQSLYPTLDSLAYHSTSHAQWFMTTEGQAGIVKISEVLTNLRNNIQELTRAWVVLGYQIPIYVCTAKKVKLFIEDLVRDYAYLKGPINVQGTIVNLPFGHKAVTGFVKHLLFHDRQYWRYISSTKNLEPIISYSSTLHSWALSEMSTGCFSALDFDVTTRQPTYNAYSLPPSHYYFKFCSAATVTVQEMLSITALASSDRCQLESSRAPIRVGPDSPGMRISGIFASERDPHDDNPKVNRREHCCIVILNFPIMTQSPSSQFPKTFSPSISSRTRAKQRSQARRVQDAAFPLGVRPQLPSDSNDHDLGMNCMPAVKRFYDGVALDSQPIKGFSAQPLPQRCQELEKVTPEGRRQGVYSVMMSQPLKRTYALYMESDEEFSDDEPLQIIEEFLASVHPRYPATNFLQYTRKLKDCGILYLPTAARFNIGFYQNKVRMPEGTALPFTSPKLA